MSGAVRSLVAAFLAPLPLLACDASTADREADAITGVLLVVCDTLRADRLDPYGGDVGTPATARLARRGVLWEDHRAQGCWTLPSMLSLMTGRYVGATSRALPTGQATLPELLSEAGFVSGAFVANGVAGPERGFDRGFDEFRLFVPETNAEQVAGAFLDWRDGVAAQPERWFAWVHLMDPHEPYGPEPRAGEALPAVDRAQLAAWRRTEELLREAVPGYDQQYDAKGRNFILRTRARYDKDVRAFDRGLGVLLDGLAQRGELDSTLVVLASDHGEALYEHPVYPGLLTERLREREEGLQLAGVLAQGHRHWFFPETWRTPLIVSGPGFERGAVGRGMSANIDIAPTVLEALGIDPPSGFDGTSLRGTLAIDRAHSFAYGNEATAVVDTSGRTWVDLPREMSGIDDPERRSGVLYRLDEQRYGLIDRYRTAPELVVELTARIDAWRETLTFEPNLDVDDSADRILIELGYVDEAPAANGGGDGEQE